MKSTGTFYVSLLILEAAFHIPSASAQGCCSVGTSALGGPERGLIPNHSLHLDVSYHFNNLDVSYNGSRQIRDPLERSASVEMLGLGVEYGVSEKIGVLVQIGYFEKERTITINGGTLQSQERVDFSGQGIGDFLVLAKYQLMTPSILSPLEITVGGGTKLPIGRYRQEVRGARLALDLQAGTGATDLQGWLYAGYSFVHVGIKVYTWILHRYPGANLDNYRYGDETLINLGITKQVAGFLEVGIASRLRVAQRDYSNGRLLQSTGGTQVSLFPHLSYISSNSVFRFFSQVPISQNLLGTQLGLSYLLGVEVGYTIDWGS